MKFNKKAWGILRNYLEGHVGELHHYAGKDNEYLFTLRPLSLKDHRSVNGMGHQKNYKDADRMPKTLGEENLKYWKELMSADDYEWFCTKGYARPSKTPSYNNTLGRSINI